VKRLLLAVLGVYLLAAVVTRLLEETGRVYRCDCLPECWCKRPSLTVFRWVTPRSRHHLPGEWVE
jgi:hypothetical protein